MKTKLIIALAICTVLSFFTPLTASANSAQKYWSGADSYGTVITDAECPVTVESELLTFNIPDFPQDYGSNTDYEASVTARYTFYNPADYTVKAKLEFPFGRSPEYGTSSDDVNKYDITVNDSSIEKTVRHTLMRKSGGFELAEDISRIADGYKEDSFFTSDLPVTKYVYEITDYDDDHKDASVAFDFPVSPDSRVYFKGMSDYETGWDFYRLSRPARYSDKTLTIYVFGQQSDAPPRWKFYKDRHCNSGEEINGSVALLSADKMTFKELAMSEYPEDSHILGSDWYNAVIDELKLSGIESYNCIIKNARCFDHFKNYLLRWYEYEIALSPGERIVNTVTAPIYPSINAGMKPPVYGYTYLLSPAQTWADFGQLDIVIDTPFYLIDNEDFEKTDTGYRLSMGGLPDGELEFSLSSSKKPVNDNSGFFVFILAVFGFLVVLIGAVVLLIGITTALTRRRR